jgi:hypothetical protein
MKKVPVKNNKDSKKAIRPALNPEQRENQMIALAIDLAEQQLLDGTASSQVITHYLKLAATKEKTKLENELLKAKTENLQAAKKSEELFAEAIKEFKSYSGSSEDDYEGQDL